MTTIAENLAAVRDRIARAALAVGRAPEEITLVAVSKTKPASLIREAYAAGQRDFGENYAQELATKGEELADSAGLRFHYIGHLQTNKARVVARWAHVVHTVDSAALAKELGKRALKEGWGEVRERMPVLVEVNVGGEPQKHGATAVELGAVLDAVTETLARGARPHDDAAPRARGGAPRVRGAQVTRRPARRAGAPAGFLHGHERRPRGGHRLGLDHGLRVGTAILGPLGRREHGRQRLRARERPKISRSRVSALGRSTRG